MYRVFVLQRPGGLRHIDMSQNVLASVKTLNRRLERKGKGKGALWRLIWFGRSLELKEAQDLLRKMQRSGGSLASLRRVMHQNAETEACEIKVEEDTH